MRRVALVLAIASLAGCGGSSAPPPRSAGTTAVRDGPEQRTGGARPARDSESHDGFSVTQYHGVTVFSRRAGGEFRLMKRAPGAEPVPLPVAPSTGPFDVELAADAQRGIVVAFARCQSRGRIEQGLERHGCRLGEVRLDGVGGERPLGPPAEADVSYRFPSLLDGQLSYVRVPDRGGPAEVVVDGRVEIRRNNPESPDSVLGLDNSARGVAVSLSIGRDHPTNVILLKRLGRPVQRVAVGYTGEENSPYLVTPTFAGRYLYWGFANHNWTVHTKRSYVFRRDLNTGTTTATVLSPYVTSIAIDPSRPDAAPVVSTDDELDSPRVLSGNQRIRTLRSTRYKAVPPGRLYYP